MTKHTFKAAALASALLMTTSPAFASGSRTTLSYTIVGAGNVKCKTMLKEIKHDPQLTLLIFTAWLGGMATGINYATPGLQDINPQTNNEALYRMVLKQCAADPESTVAKAAGTIFRRVAEREGLWDTPAVDGAERVD